MNSLPRGWATTKLGTVAKWGSGGTPSRSTPSFYGGTIPWIKTGELGPKYVSKTAEMLTLSGMENSSAKLFSKGSVALAMYGATIGKVSILGIDAATNQACGVGNPYLLVTTTDFLFHYLRSQKEAFIEAGKGGAQPNISQNVIKEWPYPLPPLAEQQRIAAKLDSTLARVNACRDRLARAAPLLKRFRQSVLTSAINGRLTANWRTISFVDIELQLTQNIDSKRTQENGELPISWRKMTLGDVTYDLRYGTSKKCSYSEDGHVVLRIPNIGDKGKIDLADIKRAEFTASEIDGLRLEIGDLLLIRSNGSADLVGKTCLVTKKEEGLLFAGYLMRLRVSTELALPAYVALTMASPELRAVIEATSKSTSGVNNINSGEVKGLPLNLPPILEQTEIIRRVETLFAFADRIEARLATAQTAVDKLTPALLAKAFRGELVPQDPADEPASELLKRLAAEREAAPKTKSKRASKTA
ncbi:restriction endonuclease subunit S [Herbaspirillum rhizosphaerae]|uniref:restriction endonuclease subunit S n=1 Tax=Herbaspirillum rhizosphaerae TaxID=346179 RepID=UPI0009FB54CA|nr:restriction endonuclease subunit S [Herbaspirillum rhizosphaerae]